MGVALVSPGVKQDFYQPTSELDPGDVLAALHDPECREIVGTLSGASMTAKELSVELAIPVSTLYRKLNMLADASLLETSIQIRVDGKNTTEYTVAFESVTIDLDNQQVGIAVEWDAPQSS